MSKQTRKKSAKPGAAAKPVAKAKATAKAAVKAATKRPAAKSAAKPAPKPAKAPAKVAAKPAAKPPRAAAPAKPAAKPAGKMTAPPRRDAKSPAATKPKPAAPSTDAKTLAEGAKAPGFVLPRDGGDSVRLADFAGQKLVIFFYPRAATPGCTREAIDFTRLADDFAACGTAVVGISADPLKAQESFRDKHQLVTPLLSDEAHQTLLAYGAWGEKSMYGKTFEGVLRTTVLLGSDGRVAKIWRGVKVDGHADEVLAAAQKL